jgi:hypothetical protein
MHAAYREHRRDCHVWQEASQRQVSLFQQYHARKVRKGDHKWTSHAALVLGVAFLRANGLLPMHRTCKTMYSMPDIKDILRLFTTLPAYHEKIMQVLEETL